MDKELIDKLLADYKTPENIVGENGLLKQLTKAILERALQAESTTHLGYEKHSPEGNEDGNTRNGTSTKRLKGDFGKWDPRYPSISALWRRNWLGIIPFFQFPPEIRKFIYTTNAIESLNMSLRKAIKIRAHFPAKRLP